MKSIDHDIFMHWLEKHFDPIKVKGYQIQVNSIFCDDRKFKLYINTEKNCWHDFKSERSGYISNLVQIIENCSYEDAVAILGGQNEIHSLDEKVKELFKNKKPQSEPPKQNIQLPANSYLINSLSEDNPFRIKAEEYLRSRKINNHNLLVCTSGSVRNRIIIPYYNQNNELIFWNARALYDTKCKYIFPENQGIGKGDVIYVPSWNIQEYLFCCEGEFNSVTLHQCGFFSAATGGKTVSDKQRDQLKKYNIVMCYDNDKAGRTATCKQAKLLMSDNGFRQVSYCVPPNPFNDWNDMLIATSTEEVTSYINNNIQPFDEIKFKNLYYKDFC